MQSSETVAPPQSLASDGETAAYQRFGELLRTTPIPPNELLGHLGLFLNRSSLSQILFMSDLYQRILQTHGVIMEFGVRWGRNLSLFSALRNIFEPHNYGRRIIGFDTFSGFPSVAKEDGADEAVEVGRLAVTEGYESVLEEILRTQEQLAPRPHLKKFELVKGDVEVTLPVYLERHPETIIAFAYFDMDIYSPTKKGLELILPYLTKGSIVGFDELCLAGFPGESVAVREVLGLDKCRLLRAPHSGYQSFFEVV